MNLKKEGMAITIDADERHDEEEQTLEESPSQEHKLDLDLLLDNEDSSQVTISDAPTLHLAAVDENGGHTRMRFLLNAGADVNARDEEGKTPLHVVLDSSLSTVILRTRILLEHGADPNAEDDDGVTPLAEVVQHEAEPELGPLIDLLLAFGADPNMALVDEEENSLLHWAIYKGKSYLVTTLLRKGADANQKNANGETPLHLAARTCGSDLSIITQLLEEGQADPCVTDNKGMTPLMTMCSHDYSFADRTDIIDLLLSYVSPPKTLYINARDKARRNALMYAGHKLYGARQVLHLLKLGADPFQLDSDGSNVLVHITKRSVSEDALKAFETLVQAGVDANCSDQTGKTALHYMALRNVPIAEALPLLLTCGVDPFRRDHAGNIPLIYACMKNDPTNTYTHR